MGKKIEEILLRFGKELEEEMKKQENKKLKISGIYSPTSQTMEISVDIKHEETITYVSDKDKEEKTITKQ